MRVLLTHKHFAPDTTTYARMLEIMAKAFSDAGHDVEVFTAQPSYNDIYVGAKLPAVENRNGYVVRRASPGRWLRPIVSRKAFSFAWFATRYLAYLVRNRKRFDVVFSTTIPPVVMGAVSVAVSRMGGPKVVYHCMDIYPEIATVAGLLPHRWIARVARWLDTATCRRAAVVVVLSRDMTTTLAARGMPVDDVRIINNFRITVDNDQLRQTSWDSLGDRFVVAFAGNLGRFQDLEYVVDAAKLLRARPDIVLVFMGEGRAKHSLIERAGSMVGDTVIFLDYQDPHIAASLLSRADLGLISLSPGIITAAYPSKTMEYLAAGIRILAVLESDSELAELVVSADIGSVCSQQDAAGLARAITVEAARGYPASGYDRSRIRSVGEREFGKAQTLSHWLTLLDNLDDGEK